MEKLGDGTNQFADSAEDAAASGHSYAMSLQEIIDASSQLAGNILGLSEAQIGYQESLAAAGEAAAENGKNLDLSTEKGRDNQSALNDMASSTWDVIEAMKAQNATTEEVRGFMEGARGSFVNTAISMGMSAEAANQLADKLGLVPGDYTARVRADTGSANAELAFTLAKLRAIAQIHIAAVQVRASGGVVGGSIPGRETGGLAGAFSMWGAETGGVRHSSVMMNEAGPEVAELPTGSRVATAGATRALADMGAFSGGGPTVVQISMAGTDDLTRAILGALRVVIKDDHGGSVTGALGQRGAA